MFLLCIFVLGFAGRPRQRVHLSFCGPKTRDFGVHGGEPPVLLLILQENQETQPQAGGDLADPRSCVGRAAAAFGIIVSKH